MGSNLLGARLCLEMPGQKRIFRFEFCNWRLGDGPGKWLRLLFVVVGLLIQLAAVGSLCLAQTGTGDLLSAEQQEVQKRFGLDPATPLESRIHEAPANVIKLFREAGTSPETHLPDESEMKKLAAALAALPPLHQRILKERLRSFSFLDNMPNTALMSSVNPDEPYRLFDITFRAAILDQSVSEWLTEKERTCFDAGDSTFNVSIDAGSMDAVLYVLLHEATHVVDVSLGITPASRPDGNWRNDVMESEFSAGIWSERSVAVPRYQDPVLEQIFFRREGKVLPVGQALTVYDALRMTPFVSLYGSSSCSEDLAEYVTVYHLTEKLKQPFRISVRNGNNEVFSYEPMKSGTVRNRVGLMTRYYDDAGAGNDD